MFDPRLLQNRGFQFLLGITVVPREIENNGDANFWQVKKCVMVHVTMVSSWFSIEVNRIQKRKELSVLLRFYFHEAMF